MQRSLAVLILAAVVVAGCGGGDPFDSNGPRRRPATQLGGQLAPVDEQGQPLGQKAPPPPPSVEKPEKGKAPPPPPPPPEDVVRQEAQPGVTGKGQDLGPGLISTPVRAYFISRERIFFQIQLPKALKMYQASNGHGPKTHEEFMEKVIKANGYTLPELPPNHRYVFDPQTQQLMVEHPR